MGHTLRFDVVEAGTAGSDTGSGLSAPMPGKVLEVLVSEGQSVTKGDALLVLEAMKMEHRILSPQDGIVKSILYKAGDQVTGGVDLLAIEKNE